MRVSNNKPHLKQAVPLIDFDLESPVAGLHTLGILCWPDEGDRETRLTAANNWVGRCYETRMIEVAEKAILYLMEAGITDDLIHAFRVLRVPVDGSEFFAPFALAAEDAGEAAGESTFWKFLGSSPSRHRLNRAPEWWQTSQFTNGDLQRDLPDYGFANSYPSAIHFDSMIAGLILLLVAVDTSPRPIRSRHAACKLIQRLEILWQPWTVRALWGLWSHWCPMAPLWAGILAETQCWRDGLWFDAATLESAIIKTVAVKTRRDRAISYAKWFATTIAPMRADNTSKPMIDCALMIRLPETICPLKPDLAGAWPTD